MAWQVEEQVAGELQRQTTAKGVASDDDLRRVVAQFAGEIKPACKGLYDVLRPLGDG